MSVGLSLLCSIITGPITEDERNLFGELDGEWFQAEYERPVYDFIRNYYTSHGEFPPRSLVLRQFTHATDCWEKTEGASRFWYDEFMKRKFGQTYDSGINSINPIVSKGCMQEANKELIRLSCRLSELGNETEKPKQRDQVLGGVLDRLSNRRLSGGIIGVPLGWDILTRITRGLVPKNIYVLAGRKKIGKSQALLYMAEAAYTYGKDVMVISMEMTEDEYSNRLASLVSGVDLNLLLSGKVSTPVERMMRDMIASEKEERKNRYIFREGFFNISIPEIENMLVMEKPEVLYIDGAYLIKPSYASAKMSGWERVTEIVKDIKRLAGRHEVPIVATYQLNKKEEIHLSESIAQIATVVMGIYLMPDRTDTRKIRVNDNRNGPRGEVTINFDFERANFSQIDGNDEMGSDLSLFGEFAVNEREEE